MSHCLLCLIIYRKPVIRTSEAGQVIKYNNVFYNLYLKKYLCFLLVSNIFKNSWIIRFFFTKLPFKTTRISLIFLSHFRFSLFPVSSRHFCVPSLPFLRPLFSIFSTRTMISFNFFSLLFSIQACFCLLLFNFSSYALV